MGEATDFLNVLKEFSAQIAANDWPHAYSLISAVFEASKDSEIEHYVQSLVRSDLGLVCRELGQLLHFERPVDALAVHHQALEWDPENHHVLNSLGALYSRLHCADEALICLKKAQSLMADPLYQRNIDNVMLKTVERWHFRMLNDKTRNSSFQRAIESAILSGKDRALDIGAGTGLLSILCHRAGAKSIVAVESSPTMFKLAQECLSLNGAESVTLVHAQSTEVSLEALGTGEKFSLIVSEVVDSGLLGEGVLPTLVDARRRLLAPGGRLIPCSVDVFMMPIECSQMRHGTRLRSSGARARLTEPYNCDLLRHIPHRPLAAPAKVVSLNFLTCEEESADDQTVLFDCCAGGTVDAVAMWFRLWLDGENSFSTGPDSGSSWDQALFFPAATEELRTVEAGDTLRCSLGWSGNSFSVAGIGVSPAVEVEELQLSCGDMDMVLLNWEERTAFYAESLERLVGLGCESVLLLCSQWSWLPSLAVKAGFKRVLCCTGSRSDRRGMPREAGWTAVSVRAAEMAVSGRGRVTLPDAGVWVWPLCSRDLCTALARGRGGDGWLRSVGCCVAEVVEGGGRLRDGILEELVACRQLLLASGGPIEPRTLEVAAQGLASPFIAAENRIDPSATAGVDVTCLNKYAVSVFQEVDLEHWPETSAAPLTPIAAVGAVELGVALDRPLVGEFRAVRGDKIDGVACWFDCVFGGGNRLQGRSREGRGRQIVHTMRGDPTVVEGQEFSVELTLQESTISCKIKI